MSDETERNPVCGHRMDALSYICGECFAAAQSERAALAAENERLREHVAAQEVERDRMKGFISIAEKRIAELKKYTGTDIYLNITDTCPGDPHKAADAFWKYWEENGETHKHGYYESTWGAISAALKICGVIPHDWSR